MVWVRERTIPTERPHFLCHIQKKEKRILKHTYEHFEGIYCLSLQSARWGQYVPVEFDKYQTSRSHVLDSNVHIYNPEDVVFSNVSYIYTLLALLNIDPEVGGNTFLRNF
jgi:hypothetical protein